MSYCIKLHSKITAGRHVQYRSSVTNRNASLRTIGPGPFEEAGDG